MKLYHLDQFGAELRKIRTDCNLSQSDVYKAIGVSEDTLRRIEHGLVIPRLDTLEYLSALYKLDIGTLFLKSRLGHHYVHGDIAETLNMMIYNNEFQELEQIITAIGQTVENENDRPTDQLFLNKLLQFKSLVEIIREFNTRPSTAIENDPLSKKIITALCLTIKDFDICYLESYILNFIEIRLLIIYCVILRINNHFNDALEVLDILLKKTTLKFEYERNYLDLLFKIHFNIAYCYHRQDMHEEVIKASDNALKLSQTMGDYSLMHAFLFRKSVALFHLNRISESSEIIKDCIVMLKIMGNISLAEQYKKIFNDMYFPID